MKKYIQYIKYILEHKKNVGIECINHGLYLHAITHDLSKFRLSEFIPYAKFFYSKKKNDQINAGFLKGWNLHQKRNRHHWNFWVTVDGNDKITPVPMPIKHIKQMICDWRGMSRKFGDTWVDYYIKNKDNFIMHKITIARIQRFIDEEY